MPNSSTEPTPIYDTLIVGTGFGGLGAGLYLAEQGAQVCLFEAVNYPGGCASTFQRRGYRFEAGATLFAGFEAGHLFDTWMRRYRWPLELERGPDVSFVAPGIDIVLPSERSAFEKTLLNLCHPEERAAAHRFLTMQRRVADRLWSLLADFDRLPPYPSVRTLFNGLRQTAPLALYAGWLGQPLADVIKAYGVTRSPRWMAVIDSICQITVQARAAEAEAVFALGVLDYFCRGTAHVRDGIGALANVMAEQIKALGSDIYFSSRVRFVRRLLEPRSNHGEPLWEIRTSRGRFLGRHVLMNTLPQNAMHLMGNDCVDVSALSSEVEQGWGACMLYRVLDDDPSLPRDAHHWQVRADLSQPAMRGHHLFCSLSSTHDRERAPEGQRTLTVSTHMPAEDMRCEHPAERVAAIQQKMRETLGRYLPKLDALTRVEMPASPRTFERFTGRRDGWVGGVPRRASLEHYQWRRLVPTQLYENAWLIGDSAFPGQSTLATALGGIKAAQSVLSRNGMFG